MKKFVVVCLTLLAGTEHLLADSNSATLAPSYDVARVTTAPVIDGVISSGEWADAAEAAGDWVGLRDPIQDTHGLRFQAMWDNENLYILGQSDYDGFVSAEDNAFAVPADPEGTSELLLAPNDPDWGGGGYSLNLYFDPNTDGERVWTGTEVEDGLNVPNSVADGYEFVWDLFAGFAARRPTEGTDTQSFRDPLDADGNQINDYYGGLFLNAFADNNEGLLPLNDAGPNLNYRDDSLPGFRYAQNASNDEESPGAVWELAISWDTFNATDPNKLVTQAEADARGPAMVLDTREFITVPDPDIPGFTKEIDNPDFDQLVPNVGQIPGVEAFIGEAGEPDLRFSDPDSPVFVDNGLYAVDGPSVGDVWAFETGAITNDTFGSFLPSWSEPWSNSSFGDPGRNEFKGWGNTEHGRLVFVESVVSTLCDPTTQGDLNRSGEVDFADFLILSGNFGNAATSHTEGDINCSGEVDFADFLVLSGSFGRTISGAESVPEPSGFVLLSIVGFAVGLLRRRRD